MSIMKLPFLLIITNSEEKCLKLFNIIKKTCFFLICHFYILFLNITALNMTEKLQFNQFEYSKPVVAPWQKGVTAKGTVVGSISTQ